MEDDCSATIGPNVVQIRRIEEELPAGFDALSAEARAEGHRFLDRLVEDWRSGAMRFTRPGEALMAAYADAALTAVGGLTVDPIVPRALRMRRFYVRPEFRRLAIGRSIALMLLDRAFMTTSIVVLNAAPRSYPFWESLGFVEEHDTGRTHIFRTGKIMNN